MVMFTPRGPASEACAMLTSTALAAPPGAADADAPDAGPPPTESALRGPHRGADGEHRHTERRPDHLAVPAPSTTVPRHVRRPAFA
ncbi:hypothetical protein RKD48_003905 [Streptomyces ambofaciens]